MRSAAATAIAVIALLLGGCADSVPEPDHAVGLGEWFVGIPETIAAGELVLDVRNGGQAHHNLTICPSDGEGCTGSPATQRVLAAPQDARDPDAFPSETTALVLGASWTATVAVDLEPGTYRFYCAIVGHAGRGMDTFVTAEG